MNTRYIFVRKKDELFLFEKIKVFADSNPWFDIKLKVLFLILMKI
jgi:hypothetical protein